MASIRGILNIQSLNELTSEKYALYESRRRSADLTILIIPIITGGIPVRNFTPNTPARIIGTWPGPGPGQRNRRRTVVSRPRPPKAQVKAQA